MITYHVNFLGIPSAQPKGAEGELRSKKTWAVLASLALSNPLSTRRLPTPVSRQLLAERLWNTGGRVDPRTSLRQCVKSLQNAFPDCILADRNTIQVVPGRFISDIELMLSACEQAKNCSYGEERLYRLIEAEGKIGGEFLEGCIPEADHAYNWWLGWRDEVWRKAAMVRLSLAAALEEAQNDNAAFDIAWKLLQSQPEHAEARRLLWKLAVKTGQEKAFHALEAAEDLEEAIARLDKKPNISLSMTDNRVFAALVEAEIDTLSEEAGEWFRRLCVFPTPFSAKSAKQISEVASSQLNALANTALLQRCGKEYQTLEVVRNCAWWKLPATTRRQLTRRLALSCLKIMASATPPENVLPAPLGALEKEKPLLRLTLEWVLEQDPAGPYVSFINMLRYCGVHDLAQQGLPYLQRVYADPLLPSEMRLSAALSASYILMQADDYRAAIRPLEIVLPVAASVFAVSKESSAKGSSAKEKVSDVHWLATLHATLMMNYSRADDWEKARGYGQEALKFHRLEGSAKGEVHCLRILAEIHHHTGEFAQALRLCEQALALRRAEPFSADDLPDALYWQARILYRLKRLGEAADAVEEALSLWQQAGDTKIGLCLCLMGQIRAAQGRFAEGQAHVSHALLLHERAKREAHQMETVEVLGDISSATNDRAEAHRRYQECLRYYETHHRLQCAQRVQQKLALTC